MRTGARIAALGAALGGAAFGLVRLQRGRDGGLGDFFTPKSALPPGYRIREDPSPTDNWLSLDLYHGSRLVGGIDLVRAPMDDEDVYLIHSIEVNAPRRGRGLGTRLYERAAKEACRRGAAALVSNDRISDASRGFWKKQIRKGRAEVVGTDPSGAEIISLPCPAPESLARLGGLPPNAELNVKEEPRRSDIIPPGFEICARQPGGHPFGCITARRADWLKKEPGPTPFEVNGVWVASGLQRRGIATKLYEAAAAEACKRGAPLQSDMERSPEADRFWRKQKRKGRAVPMKRILVDEEVNFFRLPCPAPADLSKALSGASGALGRAPIKARCEPIFTPQELKSLPPRFRQDNPKKCFFRKRGRFRAAKFRNKREPFRFFIVHPSTKRPGRCQKTEFDDRGAVGDREFATCAEAVADISPRQWRLDKVVK